MLYIARTTTGTVLVGDSEGFVPAASIDPSLRSTRDVLPLAAAGALSIDRSTGDRIPREAIDFGTPLAEFGKLWGIGLNYIDHAADLGERRPDEPASFMKPATTVRGPGGPIPLPPRSESERVTAEAEIGVVIGRVSKGLTAETVSDVIAGYLPIIDMTAEDVLQRNPRFLTRAKSYDGFLVLGPWIAVPEAGLAADTEVRTVVNGAVEARNTVDQMLFDPASLVEFHSSVMTLEIGDVISTGTPGAHEIHGGDVVTAEVDAIGSASAEVVGPASLG